MAIPLLPNTTCDVYRTGNSPPAAPDVAGVRLFLRGNYAEGLEHGEGDAITFKYTDIALVNLGVDIRDDYSQGVQGGFQDNIYVPDRTGTKYKVIFVERALRGTGADHKKVYLQRASALP